MEKMTWQPIETAPKDGSMIIVINSSIYGKDIDIDIGIVKWNKGEWIVSIEACQYGTCPTEIEKPTHWMPLPEPPQ